MVILTKILVATDFEDASAAALNYGRALATAFGATLNVLHVTEDLAAISAAGSDGSLVVSPEIQEGIERAVREETEALLTEDDRRLLHAKAITITNEQIAQTIVEYARNNQCDLILMGTHGRSGLRKLVMGSVAERVARTAPCPVLVAHAPQDGIAAPDIAMASTPEATAHARP